MLSRRFLFGLPLALPALAAAATAKPAMARYANGGVVRGVAGRTWAGTIGERGPEAILPLKRLSSLTIEIDQREVSDVIARIDARIAAARAAARADDADRAALAHYVGG